MRHGVSLLFSLILTYIIFLQLAFMHTDRIQIQSKITKPTTFYTLYKPKLKQQKKTLKKRRKQKQKVTKERVSKKIAKNISMEQTTKPTKPTPKTEEPVLDISEVTQEAVVIQKIIPKYPDLARKAGIECNVLLEVIINEKGKVESAKVVYVSRKGYGFEKNALNAVKTLRFEPFIQDGTPINVKVVYPLNFVLLE